jgi:hypothetical protein
LLDNVPQGKKAGRKRFKVTASGDHAKRLSLKSVSNVIVIFGGGKSTLHHLKSKYVYSGVCLPWKNVLLSKKENVRSLNIWKIYSHLVCR